MKRTLIPILLVIMMALGVSVAIAANFSSSGPYDSSNGWTASVNWNGNSPVGTAIAHAEHALTTASSGQFTCDVEFTIKDQANSVEVLLIGAKGTQTSLTYMNGYLMSNENYVSPGGMSIGTYHALFSSDDGLTWHVDIGGVGKDLTINDVPASIYIAARNNASASNAPIVSSVTFVSADSTPAPEPTAQPAASDNSAPAYDVAQVQNFYNNVYPKLGSPYDTVTYNADGSYNIVKGYPTSATHYVAGTVTSAADGSPIAGASVVLGNTLQKTDSVGKFKFEDIANGITDIAVSADGFAGQSQSVNVDTDKILSFNLDKAAAGGSTVASAANESANITAATNVTMPTNATVAPTLAPTTAPSATQTQSPGFEGILAAIAMIGVAGALVYLNKKH